MKYLTTTLILVLALGAAPALAMHHDRGSHGDHGSMHTSGHDGMKMDANMTMLGEQTVEGVKALSHVKDVKTAMARMGMKETHHFMVNFVDKAGKPVTEGTVAVKIKDPAGKEGAPLQLLGMDGHFGADVVLADRGRYTFTVGTRLADGTTRQYEFIYEVK